MKDLIDRQAAIELIHSLYPSAPLMRINRKRWEEKYKPYIEAEKALEQSPSAQPDVPDTNVGDTISRQAAIEDLRTTDINKVWDIADVELWVNELPPAHQENHFCNECRWARYHGEVDKRGNVESVWYCARWTDYTDEKGFCHKWMEKATELLSGRPEHECTMEEFMCGQDMGDPEDGSL